jgi:acyl-coenzyme A thioesterase PaaI-like protein
MTPPKVAEEVLRPWLTTDPDRVVARGHPIGDFLEAWDWRVTDRAPGRLRVQARLPDRVMNPRGNLFGGFTPTYVDFFALHVTHTLREDAAPISWQQTANLRVDYFAPIVGPELEMQGEILNSSGRTHFVEVRFVVDGRLCAIGQATLIQERA